MTRRGLAFYLGVAAGLQLLLYAVWSLFRYDSLFYFDPRIGLYFVQTSFLPAFFQGPGPLSWLSAAWLASAAVKVSRSSSWVAIYRRWELILALPTLIFAGLVVATNMSAAHGFSVPELLIPFFVFLPFSVFPYVLSRPLANAS